LAILTEASSVACPFFEHFGFVTIEEQNVLVGGCSFRRYAMGKAIGAAAGAAQQSGMDSSVRYAGGFTGSDSQARLDVVEAEAGALWQCVTKTDESADAPDVELDNAFGRDGRSS